MTTHIHTNSGAASDASATPDENPALDTYRQLMSEWFGFSELRPAQEAVLSALETSNVFTVAPTGSGKSMSYMLPALRSGKVLVVSPHIALMQDQVESLQANGVNAAFINSTLTNASKRQTYLDFRSGKISLLYTSPESLANRRFISGLAAIDLNLLAIDEAHCVSEWGHTFRPEYLRLKEVREALGSPRTIGLTATATPLAREDIVRRLGLEDSEQIVNSIVRDNLKFSVQSAMSNEQKRELLVQYVTTRKGLSGIVYVGSRKRTDELADVLVDSGVKAMSYHAGLDAETRRDTQRAFMTDEVDVIVATNAFGLGVDKPDVRFIVHFDMPGRLEAYYQEAGRAGRDGETAECELIYTGWSRNAPEYFISQDHPDDDQVREFWHEMLQRPEPDGEYGYELYDVRRDGQVMALRAMQDSGLVADDGVTLLSRDPAVHINTGVITRHMHYELEMLAGMVEFATTSACRLNVVLNYFGESTGDVCGRCDNCMASSWDRAHGQNGASGRKRSSGRSSISSPERIHIGDPEWPLFDALRDWRKFRAVEDGVPPFVVFHDRVLSELARKQPVGIDQLTGISGVGTVKRDRYGNDLIRVIADFLRG